MALQLKADGKTQGRDSSRAWVLLKLWFPLLFVLPSSSRAEEASLSPAGGCRYLNPLPWGGVRCYHSSLLSCHIASIIFFCCCCWTQNRWEIFPLACAAEEVLPQTKGNFWCTWHLPLNQSDLEEIHDLITQLIFDILILFHYFFVVCVTSVSWCHWFFAKISLHWMGTGTDTWSPNLGRFCPSVIINFMFSQY